MEALNIPTSFVLICLDAILNTHLSPEGYVAVLNIDLKLNFPQLRLDSETDLLTEPLLRKPDIYLADLEQLNETIGHFQDKTTFNPRAKFIFLTEESVTEDQIGILTKFFISNVIFINRVSGEISTYYPYKKKAIHDMDKEVFAITNCSNSLENLFEDKVSKTWNDSTIKFCYYHEPPYSIGPDEENQGLNLDIFGFIASLIRLKPVWTSLEYPKNGDLVNYSYQSVKTNEICDLNCELYPIAGLYAEFTQPHVFDEIPLFVPIPLQIPRWQYLLKSLTVEIWMFWFFASLTLSLAWLLVLVVLEKRLDVPKMLEVFWLNLEYFIEKSHDVTNFYLSSRFLFFFVLLQSFLLNMIFKCNFNLVLSGIIFEKPIASLKDIADRGLVFGLYQLEEMDNIVEIIGDGRHVRYEPCDGGDYCFNRTAFDRDMAVHQSLRVFKYRQGGFLDENGSPLVVKLDPPYMETGLCAILPLGHPLTPAIDKYILLSHAYGFGEFFVNKYDHGGEKKLPFQLQLTKLTLEHIMAPSALLLGGFIAGVAMFLFEVRRGCKKRQLRSRLNNRN